MTETKAVYRVTLDNDYPPETTRFRLLTRAEWQALPPGAPVWSDWFHTGTYRRFTVRQSRAARSQSGRVFQLAGLPADHWIDAGWLYTQEGNTNGT
jgi:hypothetical protein